MLGATLFSVPNAHAQLANGGFETPVVSNGSISIISAGSSIGAWTVVGGDVVLVNTNYGEPGNGITRYNAQEGLQSVDLTGTGKTGTANGVRQDVATNIGQNYTLSFFVGRASGNSLLATPSTVDLSINNGSRVSFTNSNSTPGFVNWQQFTTSFFATGTTTRITFFNGTTTANFAGVDNVRLTTVGAPEPGTFALVLFGVTGFGARRVRRRKGA